MRGWLNITKDVNLHWIESDSAREIYLEQVNYLNSSIQPVYFTVQSIEVKLWIWFWIKILIQPESIMHLLI